MENCMLDARGRWIGELVEQERVVSKMYGMVEDVNGRLTIEFGSWNDQEISVRRRIYGRVS